MNDLICPRCGGTNPPNAAFCATCGAPLAAQPPANIQPPPPTGYNPPPPPPPTGYNPPPGGYNPPPVPGSKVLGDNTKWALGLGLAALFCCGPVTGVIGLILAKKDMDEIAAGRAPQLDAQWAKWAFYLNIIGLVLFVAGLCLWWGGMRMTRF